MSISDLTIIYLACGAPFAVYFYLQNRRRLFSRHLIFKTVLNFIFWIPFSLRFLFGKLFSRRNPATQTGLSEPGGESSGLLQKQLENLCAGIFDNAGFYEFRETLNRYIGLSLSVLNENRTISGGEREIFRFSEFDNAETGAICLHRRNRQRLLFHQRLAGADFAKAVFSLTSELKHREKLETLSLELTKVLSDPATANILRGFFIENLQISGATNVEFAEKSIWNSPQPNLPNREQILLNTNSMNRINLPLGD